MSLLEICAILSLPAVIVATMIGVFLEAYIKKNGIEDGFKKVLYVFVWVLLIIYASYAVWWHVKMFSEMKDGVLKISEVFAIASLVLFCNIVVISAAGFVFFYKLRKGHKLEWEMRAERLKDIEYRLDTNSEHIKKIVSLIEKYHSPETSKYPSIADDKKH